MESEKCMSEYKIKAICRRSGALQAEKKYSERDIRSQGFGMYKLSAIGTALVRSFLLL